MKSCFDGQIVHIAHMDTEWAEGPVNCHRELRSVGSGVEIGLVQELWRPCVSAGLRAVRGAAKQRLSC